MNKMGQPQKREIKAKDMKIIKVRLMPDEQEAFRSALKANGDKMQEVFEGWVKNYIKDSNN